MSGSPKLMADQGGFLRSLAKVGGVVGVFFILFFLALGPMKPGNIGGSPYWVQGAHEIGMMMVAYSQDHDGNYPDGKSSTEVFQKLLDGRYGTDPAVFYIPLPGKIPPMAGQKLKPENVCWDVTSGVDSSSPDRLPVVFMTGFKVIYAPGGSVEPIIKPYPQFGHPHTWTQSYYGVSWLGIAVFYKNNYSLFVRPGEEWFQGKDSTIFQYNTPPRSDGSSANFLPPDFDAHGKAYRQLTPDGALP